MKLRHHAATSQRLTWKGNVRESPGLPGHSSLHNHSNRPPLVYWRYLQAFQGAGQWTPLVIFGKISILTCIDVSQQMHRITTLWKFWLNYWSIKVTWLCNTKDSFTILELLFGKLLRKHEIGTTLWKRYLQLCFQNVLTKVAQLALCSVSFLSR